MAEHIGELLGSTALILFPFWFVASLAFMFAFPVMCFSVVRNIRKIARELERANDYREHYDKGKPWTPVGL